MDDVLLERKTLTERIAGATLLTRLADTARQYADQPAYSDRRTADGTGWRTVSWGEVREGALDVAAGLVTLGVEPGERVCIMASSRIEHVLADSGALHAGAVPISVYATLSPAQVTWYARHAAPHVVVLEGAEQLERWALALADEQVQRTLTSVVVLDAAAAGEHLTWDGLVAAGRELRAQGGTVLAERAAGVTPDQPATILYTSGTTGDPKGVVLTHGNVLFECEASIEAGQLAEPGITISYLPLAHIAERVLGLYIPQVQSGHVHLIADPAQLVGALAEVRPTRFFGVPRVWEKIMTGVAAKLAMEPDEQKRAAVAAAMEAGRAWVLAQQVGAETTPEIEAAFAQWDGLVLAPMRALLGLDRAKWTASAAAPMPLEVASFFAGLGLRILDVYGMTETTASVCAGTPDAFRMGTVGRPMPGIEIKLDEDGEILARGPVVTPGYHANPKATAELIDGDGWAHTGDIGQIDAEGFLKVVDRKKEMIITSSGKNIAPSVIENYLKESPLVGHAMAIGDGKPYVVALLTLDGEIAPLIAAKLGIEDTSVEALAAHPQIRAMVQQAVDRANERLSRPEQVKKWELLPMEWTAESAELTPTLKLKRRVVHEHHAAAVEALYG
ncbi:long-chain acyl-CoA synthetase [Nocardioides phosphati]|uniref:Acyl-CoA synthetase n=1 Tax=Nocardioides phosphati TaxID=1867775 RepID=A0ABQ2NEV0_9ACTN|nr:AMP-dependent synthetase/ligase [Nocardioides phosphati]GGO93909.1 long-chain acyl-CoA synthetase [Nocardioides phosphati]